MRSLVLLNMEDAYWYDMEVLDGLPMILYMYIDGHVDVIHDYCMLRLAEPVRQEEPTVYQRWEHAYATGKQWMPPIRIDNLASQEIWL